MTEAEKSDNPAAKSGAATPCDNSVKTCSLADKKYEIIKIEVQVEAPDNKVIMNDPDNKCLVKALVTYKKSKAKDALNSLPDKVVFTFTDPGGNNTEKLASFNYTGTKFLGKKADASAVFWQGHAAHSASSDDSFKSNAKVTAKSVKPDETMEAKVHFKPSGVGGDDYKITATIYKADGSTEIVSDDSATFTVWRKVHFEKVYSMESESYIDSGSSVASVSPAFKTKAFVEYTRENVNQLDGSLDVKYIGLYKSGGGSKNWPDDFAPDKLEANRNQLSPTDIELADYGGTDLGKKAIAKTKIEVKAQLWFNAIVSDYKKSVSDWFDAAAVPAGKNTLLAVQYYHPKLSNQADGATEFWPAGISINLANPGSGLDSQGDPDKATWREVQGFNKGDIVVVFKNYGTPARLKIICRHEVGHATKSAFRRDEFGTGDHSASGLMTPYGGSQTFSRADIKILRGM